MKPGEMVAIVKQVVDGVEKCLGVEIGHLKEALSKVLEMVSKQDDTARELEKRITCAEHEIEKIKEKYISHEGRITKLEESLESFEKKLDAILKNVKFKRSLILGIIASPVLMTALSIGLPWLAKALKWAP